MKEENKLMLNLMMHVQATSNGYDDKDRLNEAYKKVKDMNLSELQHAQGSKKLFVQEARNILLLIEQYLKDEITLDDFSAETKKTGLYHDIERFRQSHMETVVNQITSDIGRLINIANNPTMQKEFQASIKNFAQFAKSLDFAPDNLFIMMKAYNSYQRDIKGPLNISEHSEADGLTRIINTAKEQLSGQEFSAVLKFFYNMNLPEYQGLRRISTFIQSPVSLLVEHANSQANEANLKAALSLIEETSASIKNEVQLNRQLRNISEFLNKIESMQAYKDALKSLDANELSDSLNNILDNIIHNHYFAHDAVVPDGVYTNSEFMFNISKLYDSTTNVNIIRDKISGLDLEDTIKEVLVTKIDTINANISSKTGDLEEAAIKRNKEIFTSNLKLFLSDRKSNPGQLMKIEEYLNKLNKTDVNNNEYSETFKKFFEDPIHTSLSTASLVYLFVNKNRYPQTCKIANAYIKDITKYLTSENRRAIKRLYLLKFKTNDKRDDKSYNISMNPYITEKLNTDEKLFLENRLSLSYVFALITYATRNIINFIREAKINSATKTNMYAANKPEHTPTTVNPVNYTVNHKKPSNTIEPDNQTEDKEVKTRKGPRI